MFNKAYLKNLNNDLETIVFKKYPKLENVKFFLSAIPDVTFARMSGSGSTIVAYFHSKKACNIALKHFKRRFIHCFFMRILYTCLRNLDLNYKPESDCL